ncbi:MAG: NifB/NifX family molybdenum-iron cluster-binding protein [Acidobacteriota bacterium]|jgi:predicted Fe-Mo cluster-binding NifX family protein|nr:dinitrogenase iron-molybdenum cofactor biosynthesis protein [Acidobacteriota bacterium]
MRVAFATWNGRIAPVFDVTRRLHVVETDGRRVVRESEEPLEDEAAGARAARLAALHIGALVCGAISRPQEALVQAYGVTVVPFVTGELREVVNAWRAGALESNAFAMPGCGRGRGRRFRGGRGWIGQGRRRQHGGVARRRSLN